MAKVAGLLQVGSKQKAVGSKKNKSTFYS